MLLEAADYLKVHPAIGQTHLPEKAIGPCLPRIQKGQRVLLVQYQRPLVLPAEEGMRDALVHRTPNRLGSCAIQTIEAERRRIRDVRDQRTDRSCIHKIGTADMDEVRAGDLMPDQIGGQRILETGLQVGAIDNGNQQVLRPDGRLGIGQPVQLAQFGHQRRCGLFDKAGLSRAEESGHPDRLRSAQNRTLSASAAHSACWGQVIKWSLTSPQAWLNA